MLGMAGDAPRIKGEGGEVGWEITHKSLPTIFSSTELFPLDWLPTTTIWGRSIGLLTPTVAKTSWSLLTSLEKRSGQCPISKVSQVLSLSLSGAATNLMSAGSDMPPWALAGSEDWSVVIVPGSCRGSGFRCCSAWCVGWVATWLLGWMETASFKLSRLSLESRGGLSKVRGWFQSLDLSGAIGYGFLLRNLYALCVGRLPCVCFQVIKMCLGGK